jgi:dTMP kinase
MKRGRLFVFEGIDGSGKTTQCENAMKTLRQEHPDLEIVTFDFPGYNRNMFGSTIGRFLKGEYGDPSLCDPFHSTILFAADRFHKRSEIIDALSRGAIVVLNRYVSSNVAYSCAKLRLMSRESEIPLFRAFSNQLEHETFGLPKPDLILLLNMEPSLSSELVFKKAPRDYLEGEDRDAHESNSELQNAVQKTYVELAKDDTSVWAIIECSDNDQKLRSIEDIEKEVKAKILSALYSDK